MERGIRLNVLITGSNGFIGKSLVEQLLSKKQHKVTAVLRDRKNFPLPDCKVLEIRDFTRKGIWEEQLNNIDVIVHAAGRAHIMKERSKKPLEEYRKHNVTNTLFLAREAAKIGVKRFIYLSTIKVNGEKTTAGQPFKADDNPSPVDPYAISKLEAEKSLFDLSGKTEMEVVCIRPPLIYGPGVKGNLSLLLKFIEKGIPLPLGSITSNKRSFVSITNLIDLIEVCLVHPKAANEIFLVSDNEDISTVELIIFLAKAMGKPPRLFNLPLPILKFLFLVSGNKRIADRLISNLQVEITKTTNILGWSPSINLEQGLLSILKKKA